MEHDRLLLHESHDPACPERASEQRPEVDGQPLRTWLERSGSELSLREAKGDGTVQVWHLPAQSVSAVMQRYGRPLDESLVDLRGATDRLLLPEGQWLVRLRFRPRYDVIAKDYLVLDVHGREPIAELATTVSAALAHLGRALAESRSD